MEDPGYHPYKLLFETLSNAKAFIGEARTRHAILQDGNDHQIFRGLRRIYDDLPQEFKPPQFQDARNFYDMILMNIREVPSTEMAYNVFEDAKKLSNEAASFVQNFNREMSFIDEMNKFVNTMIFALRYEFLHSWFKIIKDLAPWQPEMRIENPALHWSLVEN